MSDEATPIENPESTPEIATESIQPKPADSPKNPRKTAGRPRKNPEAIPEPESIQVKAAALPDLKLCPVCGGKAEVFKDRNKLFRCACKSCGFWDSVPNYTEGAAAASWNAAGGPNPAE